MKLEILTGEFTIGQLPDFATIDFFDDFLFLAKTDEEYSIVCRSEHAPSNLTAAEAGWRAFRIVGQLEFSLIGILAKISNILAAQKIGIFVVSTFKTDYILVKRENLNLAIASLSAEDYEIDAAAECESDPRRAGGSAQ
jgi:hypothetical protein